MVEMDAVSYIMITLLIKTNSDSGLKSICCTTSLQLWFSYYESGKNVRIKVEEDIYKGSKGVNDFLIWADISLWCQSSLDWKIRETC